VKTHRAQREPRFHNEDGLFATLRGLLGFTGTRAPKITQGTRAPKALFLLPALIAAALFALPGVALAAAPETPELTVNPIWASTVTFNGTLNPHATAGEPGTYKYLYKQGPSCVGGIENGGIVAGEPGEVLPAEVVKGLTASSEYTVCLSFTSAATTETSEATVTFTTAVASPPEAPEATAVSERKAESVTLNGVVNPLKEGEPGHYRFVYRQNPTECTGAGAVETTEEEAPGSSPQGVSVGIGGLEAGKPYTFCVKAFNALGTGTLSAPEHFTTAITPETPTATKVKPGSIAATTAEVEGELNHLKAGEKGTFEVLYKVSPLAEAATGQCEENATSAPTSGVKEEKVTEKLTSLQPNAKYTFCLRAKNEAGEESAVSTAKTFSTLPAPATIDSLSASHLKSSEATLEGTVNPNNQLNECHFQYGISSVEENTVPCSPEQLKGYGEQSVSPTKTEVVEGNIVTVPAPITGLTQGTEYKYRILTKNGKGEEATEEKTFRTVDEPEKQAASEVTATTATLNGVLNPHNSFEAGTYEFLYKQSEGECTAGSVTPAATSTTESPQPEEAKIAGLQPGVVYTFCLLQRNAAGEEVAISAPETFATPIAPPAITAEQVTHITETAAILQANIDPDGAETTYHFEYDTTPYTTSAPHGTSITVEGENTEVNIGAGTTPVPVEVKLKGLTPGVTYYYRVVAENEVGGKTEMVDGPGKTFTTATAQTTNSKECANEQRRAEQPFGLTLPDCRAYEMVSPVQTLGQDATDSFVKGSPRAAESGEAVTYVSRGSFAEPTGETEESQFLSRRGPEGWSTQSITPLHNPIAAETNSSYEALTFTPNLEEGIASTSARLTSEAPMREPREPLFGLYLTDFASNSYRYIGPAENQLPFPFGASSDLSHVVFGAKGTEAVTGDSFIEEWVNGKVIPVGVANNGDELEAAVGSPHWGSYIREKEVWHAVSANGSRVYFTSPGDSEPRIGDFLPGALYVRVNAEREQSKMKEPGLPGEECLEPAEACTIEVSSAGASGARYWGASANGEKVFYTKEGDLYRYSLPLGQTTGGRTTAITADGEVQGVVQISEEGQYVYFVANGVLGDGGADGAAPGDCRFNTLTSHEEGHSCNLYVSHEGGAPVFIATLAAGDASDWLASSIGAAQNGGPATHTAVVTPAGTQFAFTSYGELTGYDNHDANTGKPDDEIYLYDAETQNLVCASCNPNGVRPLGSSSFGSIDLAFNLSFIQYQARNLIEGGALFFDSSDALVSHASDGRQNVYEYEDGHVYPISNVAGGSESFFMDASANGENVFFGSADRLLPQDPSDNVVVWDARQDGGFPVAVAAPPCTTAEACRTAGSPPPGVFGAPPSATFSGPGNTTTPPSPSPVVKPKPKSLTRAQKLAAALKGCRKARKKAKRQSCEKQARAKYGTTKKKAKAKKSSNDRRTNS
jgi:hypothetical protein